MRLVILAVVAAILVQGYLSASVNDPPEDSKNVVKRQAPSLPNFMGGFRPPNMGAMGAPGMGAMRPGMGAMGPPGLGGMGHPYMPPNMFRPPNFADAQSSNSSDGSSFGFGWLVSNDTNGNSSSQVVTNDQDNPTEYNGNRTADNPTEYNGNRTADNPTEYNGNRTADNPTEYNGNRTADH